MSGRKTHSWTIVSCLFVCFVDSSSFAQGPLAPPGAPVPTMKTLDQVEPRRPISSLPFQITQLGSYYLTTNLVGTADNDGITISASGVSIDLMGFELIGAPGSGSGIYVSGVRRNIAIRNGTIRGWGGAVFGGHGIEANLCVNSQFDRLRVSDNSFVGLWAGEGSTISHCTVRTNGSHGIRADAASVITDCTAWHNAEAGIHADVGSTITRCAAWENRGGGFDASHGTVVDACTAIGNWGHGFAMGQDSRLLNSTARGNTTNGILASFNSYISGCVANSNGRDGINVSGQSVVVDSQADSNGTAGPGTGAGIRVSSFGTRVDNNTVTGNDWGVRVNDAGNIIMRNTARGNTTNYSIVGGNSVGGIVNVAGAGFTNTNPWVNFEY